MNMQEVIEASLGRMEASVQRPAGLTGTPEAIGDRLRILIDLLKQLFGNIDLEEAAAIMAKIEEAKEAFANNAWLVGVFAVAAALQLYRDAIKD